MLTFEEVIRGSTEQMELWLKQMEQKKLSGGRVEAEPRDDAEICLEQEPAKLKSPAAKAEQEQSSGDCGEVEPRGEGELELDGDTPEFSELQGGEAKQEKFPGGTDKLMPASVLPYANPLLAAVLPYASPLYDDKLIPASVLHHTKLLPATVLPYASPLYDNKLMLGAMLLTWHNLHYYQELMVGLRAAISAGSLEAFVADFTETQAKGDIPPI